MKKLSSTKSLIVAAALCVLPGAASAATLLEIYQQALQSDPLVHEAEARRLAALEASPQARGVLFPQVSFSGGYTESSFENPSAFFGDQIVDLDVESETTDWTFTARQTLFRWDQIVGLRQADKLVARAEADREAAQQDLIVRVTQRYFDVLAAEDRLRAIHANRTAIARQLEQAKQRFEVGLIAITAVQESQAAFDQAIADEILAKRQLATAREFLREITGEYVSDLDAPSDDLPLNSPDPASESAWIDLALGQNLALTAARLDERLARDEISSRRNGHYPTIDIVARAGSTDSTDTRVIDGIGFPSIDAETVSPGCR